MNLIFKWFGIIIFIININSHAFYLFSTCFSGPSNITCPTDFCAGGGQVLLSSPGVFICRSVMFVELYSDKLAIFFVVYKITLPCGSSCQILVIFSLFSVIQTIMNAVRAQPFHRYLLGRKVWMPWCKVGSWWKRGPGNFHFKTILKCFPSNHVMEIFHRVSDPNLLYFSRIWILTFSSNFFILTPRPPPPLKIKCVYMPIPWSK